VFKKFAFLMIFTMSLLLAATNARADLTITPMRVVFSQRDRSAPVILLNTTERTNTYRLSWEIMRATADGQYVKIPYNRDTDKDPHSVPNMVFFSPRQVTIEPHGFQTIRLSVRRPSDLPPGEYRAHLLMTRLAPQEAPQKADPNAKTLSMELSVNLSFSIPVIVRQGEDKALKVSLSSPQLKLQGDGAVLSVTINRDAGTFSSYGDIEVYWRPPQGKEQLIGSLKNVALYPELKSRQVNVPITAQQNISSGNIRVAYIGKLEALNTTWAEKTFAIGK
jgi:P pilus assembly chaperone PapD